MSKESAYYVVCNLGNKHDVKEIKNGLDKLPGVYSVSLNADTSKLAVDYEDTGVKREKIEETLTKLGYDIMEDKDDNRIE